MRQRTILLLMSLLAWFGLAWCGSTTAQELELKIPGEKNPGQAVGEVEPGPERRLFHVRLAWKANPSNESTISWSTSFKGTDHHVAIRERGSDDEFRTVDCYRNQRFGRSSKTKPVYYHHAVIRGLKAGCEYDVIANGIDDTGHLHRSRQCYFRTPPADTSSTSILFGGDSRGNREMCQQMNRFIAEMSHRETETTSVLAFAHVGDYVKNGIDFEQWHDWLTDHELTTTKSGRLLPIIPARGNHDRGLIYNEVFDFEATDDNYFITQLGPLAAMITLNTEASMAGDQAKWLRKTLGESRPVYPWLLAQYHRPAYPAVGFPSGALTQWVPLFEQFDLDMACEGDGHVIKRTLPIRSNKHDATGVVYIGEGGLAIRQRTPKLDRWYLQKPGFAGRGHHLQRLTFSQKSLVCECLLVNGQVIDTWRRERDSAVSAREEN